jgi:hypothetical protein
MPYTPNCVVVGVVIAPTLVVRVIVAVMMLSIVVICITAAVWIIVAVVVARQAGRRWYRRGSSADSGFTCMHGRNAGIPTRAAARRKGQACEQRDCRSGTYTRVRSPRQLGSQAAEWASSPFAQIAFEIR